MALADIGVYGLGVMGASLARNFARNKNHVAVYNYTADLQENFKNLYSTEADFIYAKSAEDFVAKLSRPRCIVIMVTAGDATDAVIAELSPLLEPGDILIDCGNSHPGATARREAALGEKNLFFMGVGVSGGQQGALWGPSIMPGGSDEAYARVGPMLESIAAKAPDGTPCCVHVGPGGAGHLVKTVHNGIEYADMQLITEAYDLLKTGLDADGDQLARIFEEWNRGELESYLIEITATVLAHKDCETGADFVNVIDDAAGQKGTGKWTVQLALDSAAPVSVIGAATFVRGISGEVAQRQAVWEAFDSNQPCLDVDTWNGLTGDEARAAFVSDVRQALYASKIIAYAQGFDQIALSSAENEWSVDLGAVAGLWRAGCIIRARFLDRIMEAYERAPGLALLITDSYFADALRGCEAAWRRVVAAGVVTGIAVPAFSAALSYFDAMRTHRLPTALIQAQRDFFGAHSYRRVDKPGVYHVRWEQQGRPEDRLS
ncbi:MAG: NADP-dependent phosphogluconate dehydrogenase [Actinomycetaceae bacterium]|nr:NADP-dependent phosphogluconate dehydrogenase [Actinomycetaceae bacterium]